MEYEKPNSKKEEVRAVMHFYTCRFQCWLICILEVGLGNVRIIGVTRISLTRKPKVIKFRKDSPNVLGSADFIDVKKPTVINFQKKKPSINDFFDPKDAQHVDFGSPGETAILQKPSKGKGKGKKTIIRDREHLEFDFVDPDAPVDFKSPGQSTSFGGEKLPKVEKVEIKTEGIKQETKLKVEHDLEDKSNVLKTEDSGKRSVFSSEVEEVGSRHLGDDHILGLAEPRQGIRYNQNHFDYIESPTGRMDVYDKYGFDYFSNYHALIALFYFQKRQSTSQMVSTGKKKMKKRPAAAK